jgi:uncharacterized protein YdeI (YjbR/CyaY-like superfamily)
MNDRPIVLFASENLWEEWLTENYATSQGVWLKIAKKGAEQSTVSYQEALDVALCFGWIDGQKNKFDDQYWLQKFTPRRPRSIWSKVNQEKVAALIEQGRMREAGMKEIDRAKADGRWDAAYAPQSRMEVPDDLQAELDNHPDAKAFFEQLNSANRYAILHRIVTAKKPETRQKRVEKFIAMLKAGEKLYP